MYTYRSYDQDTHVCVSCSRMIFCSHHQACSGRDAVAREIKELHTQLNKEKELFRSQEKDYVERLENYKRQIDKLAGELTTSREELERANNRVSELQKEFSDKQKEFTSKLNQYLEGNLFFSLYFVA